MNRQTNEVLAFFCTLIGVCCTVYVFGELITLGEVKIATAMMGAIYGLSAGYYFKTNK